MRKHLLIGLIALMTLTGGAAAQGPAAYGYPGQHQASPAQLLRAGVERLTAFLAASPEAPPPRVAAFLEREIAPLIDFDRMAVWVAGPLSRGMGEEQRARFGDALRLHMLGALANNLAGFPIAGVEYYPPRGNPAEGQVILGLGVHSGSGIPARLDFRLMNGERGWQVVDVSANGISAVAFYRRMVQEMVRRYGFEGTLARLG